MKTETPTRSMISRQQLAERWGTTKMTLQRMEQRGVLRPVKLGEKLVRYRTSDIERIENESTLDRKVPA